MYEAMALGSSTEASMLGRLNEGQAELFTVTTTLLTREKPPSLPSRATINKPPPWKVEMLPWKGQPDVPPGYIDLDGLHPQPSRREGKPQ